MISAPLVYKSTYCVSACFRLSQPLSYFAFTSFMASGASIFFTSSRDAMALSHCVFMLMASLRVTASVKVTKFVAKSVIFRVTLDIYSRFCCSGVWLFVFRFALLPVAEQPARAHIARAAAKMSAANFFAVGFAGVQLFTVFLAVVRAFDFEFAVVNFFIVLLSVCVLKGLLICRKLT